MKSLSVFLLSAFALFASAQEDQEPWTRSTRRKRARRVNAGLRKCRTSQRNLDVCLDKWAKTYKRTTRQRLSQKQKDAFVNNLDIVLAVNDNEGLNYYADLNEYADMTFEEFSQQYLMTQASNKDIEKMVNETANEAYSTFSGEAFTSWASWDASTASASTTEGSATETSTDAFSSGAPAETDISLGQGIQLNRRRLQKRQIPSTPNVLDWTNRQMPGTNVTNWVTDIRDQGACGCCWVFAPVAAIESALLITTGGQVSMDLSEKYVLQGTNQLVSSAESCAGGRPSTALDFATTYGVRLESYYPYVNPTAWTLPNSQFTNKTDFVGVVPGARNFFGVPGRVQSILGRAPTPTDIQNFVRSEINRQPVGTYMYADANFQNYKGGVYTINNCPANAFNHIMLFVGYDAVNRFWKIKNSWGTSWGENGYVRMAMQNSVNGICGVTSYLVYPSLNFKSVSLPKPIQTTTVAIPVPTTSTAIVSSTVISSTVSTSTAIVSRTSTSTTVIPTTSTTVTSRTTTATSTAAVTTVVTRTSTVAPTTTQTVIVRVVTVVRTVTVQV